MNSPQEIFDIWAPEFSPWSLWVKPILFSQMTPDAVMAQAAAQVGMPEDTVPRIQASEKTVVVVDCPGVRSVALGIVLAKVGYRPIPQFNALPGPPGMVSLSSEDALASPQMLVSHHVSLVEVWPIVSALIAATPMLSELRLPADAPPVFLLDSGRRRGVGPPRPHRFDNRSVSFATDFPSANFLLSRGVDRVLLIQETALQPLSDLAHTLLRWQQSGIRIESMALNTGVAPAPTTIERPGFFRSLFYRLQLMAGLRPVLGGFGGTIPEESSGSGG